MYKQPLYKTSKCQMSVNATPGNERRSRHRTKTDRQAARIIALIGTVAQRLSEAGLSKVDDVGVWRDPLAGLRQASRQCCSTSSRQLLQYSSVHCRVRIRRGLTLYRWLCPV